MNGLHCELPTGRTEVLSINGSVGAIGRRAFPKRTDMLRRNIMNRRTVLSSMSMLCLAVVLATAVPQAGLAQSSPWLGMWKLNLAKSSYLAGQAPKSSTFNFQGAGANLTNTVETITAAGTPI
jgi:hypothetical protein